MTDSRSGVLAGLIAYTFWGVTPVYFKLVASVPPAEVLMHRVIWAIPFGALIIHLRKQWPEVRRALTHAQMLRWLIATGVLIAVNWFIYIVAIQTERVYQASLGYYINPLLFVLAGVLFFGERLRRLQRVAVVLATIGVLVLAISGGEFPWFALGVGVSFALYGVIRKRVVIGAMPGLFVETLVLAPLALAWWLWLETSGGAVFGHAEVSIDVLLLFAGPVTVIPLVLFAVAARNLTLTTVGFIQFLAPTLQLLTGVYYGEQLTTPRLICFAFIWSAVIAFSLDAWRSQKKRAKA